MNLAVYDINGRIVRALVDGTLDTGPHEVVWDGKDAVGRQTASGVYLVRLTTPTNAVIRKATLLR